MKSFKLLYLNTCKELNAQLCSKILERVENAENATTLDLSALEVNPMSCKALGMALSIDVSLKELNLSNCFLGDEGLVSILQGLERNKVLLSLNLKGNKIRGVGAEALGKLLRHNSRLEKLCLAWNGIGIVPEKLALFCEGLAMNSSVKHLDLQHNQISSVSGQNLADVIVRNSNLQNIDLRGNSIGLIGGRAILKALARNKHIISLDVGGNDVPTEINEAIECTVLAAARRFVTNSEQQELSSFLSSKLDEVERKSIAQARLYSEILDKKNEDMEMNEKYHKLQMQKMQNVIEEKEKAFGSLLFQNGELQKTFSNLVNEKEALNTNFVSLEAMHKAALREFQGVLDEEKMHQSDMIKRFSNEKETLQESLRNLIEEHEVLKKRYDATAQENMQLRDTIKKYDDSLNKQKLDFGETITSLKEKHADLTKENNRFQMKEISNLQDKIIEMQKDFCEKVTLAKSQRSHLEIELDAMKNDHLLEKKAHSEALERQENRFKSEKEELLHHMKEKLDIQEKNNKKLNESISQHIEALHLLQKQQAGLDISLAEKQHEVQTLNQKIQEKDIYMNTFEKKIRLEVKEQIEELHGNREKIRELEKINLAGKRRMKELELNFQKKIDFQTNTFDKLLKAYDEYDSNYKVFRRMIKVFRDEFQEELQSLNVITSLNDTSKDMNAHNTKDTVASV